MSYGLQPVVPGVDTVHERLPCFQDRATRSDLCRVKRKVLPRAPELVHERTDRVVGGLVVHLLEHQDVLVTGVPVSLHVLLGDNAALQEHVLDALDPGNLNPLADLARRLFAVQLGLIQRRRRHHLHPLAAVAFN